MRCFFLLSIILSIPVTFLAQQKLKPVRSSGESIYTKVQIEPAFKGGQSAWLQFLSKNMRIPDSCIKEIDPEPAMIIQFVVFKTGRTGRVKMIKGNMCIEKELIRLLELSDGLWTPALQNGKIVNCYKKMPLSIHVQAQ